jgi:phenylacetate-coenzyme A ligase PaaK-like adenylate-forming protein
MNLERLYLRLPVPLQNLGCTVEGLRIQRKRYGSGFRRALAEAEKRSSFSDEEIREFRDRRLRVFVTHCFSTVPYYRTLFRELGIRAEDIRCLNDLKILPVLNKATVQERGAEFVSDLAKNNSCEMVHTSGTTGGGLHLLATQEAIHEQWAIWWRYRRWHGIEPGTWCTYFGGRSLVPAEQSAPPFWRTNFAGRQLFFSAYHLTPANLKLYAEKLRSARMLWLHGYPSLLTLVAAFIADTGFDLGYQPKWVTIGAENLLPQQSEIIQRAFGVRPIQHYGMAEAVANVSQCTQGNLHVDEDFAAVEFLEDAGAQKVIGTNLSNYATPLLRYDAQDMARLSERRCDCGLPGRIVESIDGRQEDYIVLKNGARIGRLDHIFKDMVRVREAQIVQKEPGRISLRVVRGTGYSEADEQQLRREFAQRLGTGAEMDLEYVDQLARSRSGKLRFVISEMRENQLQNAIG